MLFVDVVQVVMVNAECCLYLGRFITKIVLKCPGELIAKIWKLYRSADKSLARPGRKQATAKEDFDVHVSYL
jgi:hypothetical protein